MWFDNLWSGWTSATRVRVARGYGIGGRDWIARRDRIVVVGGIWSICESEEHQPIMSSCIGNYLRLMGAAKSDGSRTRKLAYTALLLASMYESRRDAGKCLVSQVREKRPPTIKRGRERAADSPSPPRLGTPCIAQALSMKCSRRSVET